ncbi:hypothetical protein KW783_02980, partial [Candidatus Parcubacteria bacterium]|nr:hypothetical protein [Candidatus Parcubacteria bacterium]
PISKRTLFIMGGFFVLIGFLYFGKLWILQVKQGEAYEAQSEKNRLRQTSVFAERGVVYDRNNEALAWNETNPGNPDFSKRIYATTTGIAHIIGYVKYPARDTSGFYYQKEFSAKDGIEKSYNSVLGGANGLKIIETDALGKIQSESILEPPVDGKTLTLSIDSKVQHELYELMKQTAADRGFSGGAAVIMDVRNGELLSLVSYPEYSSNALTNGSSDEINSYLTDKKLPFLDRAVSGVYTPGSIIKPFVAMGVLDQNIISPTKEILSTGSISIPNPYVPGKFTQFNDWRPQGWVDLRHALAVSSNVYFFEVGGGFEDQKGLGIENIKKYTSLFGFGSKTNIALAGEETGVIPDPEWKKKNFKGEDWRVGDTYNTAIGQYGFQVTPLQIVTGYAAIANDGTLYQPTLILDDSKNQSRKITIDPNDFQIIREGMRLAVTEGTAVALNIPFVKIAAKSGTAELGVSKANVNSWITGFFPYDNPHYAFAIVMEKGSRENLIGSTFVARSLFEWMNVYAPEYLE